MFLPSISSVRNEMQPTLQKTIQNKMIDVIGTAIGNNITEEVKSSKYYSIIADEVTDCSNKEQLSLSLRYVTDENVREMFLDFIKIERITGQALSDAILHWLEENGLQVADMRGQCYDGDSSMCGSWAGCQALIQKEAPKAIYVHCSSHKLNLAIVSACKISAFKNNELYIGEISRFFAYSTKKQRLLDKAIESTEPSTRVKKLKDVCRIHWIQRIDSYIVFEELLPAVHTALKAMVNSYPVHIQSLILTGLGTVILQLRHMASCISWSHQPFWFAFRYS